MIQGNDSILNINIVKNKRIKEEKEKTNLTYSDFLFQYNAHVLGHVPIMYTKFFFFYLTFFFSD